MQRASLLLGRRVGVKLLVDRARGHHELKHKALLVSLGEELDPMASETPVWCMDTPLCPALAWSSDLWLVGATLTA